MSQPEDDATVAELLRLDDWRCELSNAGDVAGSSELLADDLVYVHGNGRTENKDEFLKRNVAAETRPKRTRGKRSVRIYGDVAVMIGPQLMETADGTRIQLLATQVWRRDGGQWKQTTFHACRLPDA